MSSTCEWASAHMAQKTRQINYKFISVWTFHGAFCIFRCNIDRCMSSRALSFWVLIFTRLWRVYEDDPALFFGRFCDLVNSITEEAWKGPEEGDCDNETLEVTPHSDTPSALAETSLALKLLFHRNALRTSKGQMLVILLISPAVPLCSMITSTMSTERGWFWEKAPSGSCMPAEISATRSVWPSKKSLNGTAGEDPEAEMSPRRSTSSRYSHSGDDTKG